MPEERLFRFATIDRAKIDKEKRTVEMSFSSETPVRRWDGDEVLSHADGDYDFTSLGDAGPLMLGHDEHNPRDQIGVIERCWVGDDKIGRVSARFSTSPDAEAVWQDVLGEIRKHTSVGYSRAGLIRSDKIDGKTTNYFKWKAFHVAIVPVPADKVGIGRAASVDFPEVTTMPEAPVITAAEKAEAEKQAEIRATNIERTRVADIRRCVAAILKDRPDVEKQIRELELKAVEGTTTTSEFQAQALTTVLGAPAPREAKRIPGMREMGVPENDIRNYSILRAIQNVIEHKFCGVPVDGIEREMHDEICKRMNGTPGWSPEGFVTPHDAPVRISRAGATLSGRGRPGIVTAAGEREVRDLNVQVFSQGGALVPTEYITPIIEILRNKLSATRLGIRIMAGLSGNPVIPRQTGAATAQAAPEQGALTISTQTIDQISLTPHRAGAFNQYSKQLLLQSAIDAENFMRDDLMKVMAIFIDSMVLQGQGGNSQPTGIMNTPGILTNVFGGAPTWTNIVQFETNIANANAITGPMGWIVDPTTKGVWKTTAKTGTGVTSVVPIFLWDGDLGNGDGDGFVNGYRAIDSLQIPNHQVLQGVFDEEILAMWGGFDWVVNPYSLDTLGTVRITVQTFFDCVTRHPQCFCLSPDSGAV
jgi:hypothetical protein